MDHGDRRKGPDFVKLWPSVASFIGWGIVFYIGLIIAAARPYAKDAISQLLGSRIQAAWNDELLYRAYFSSLFLGLFSLISMVIDFTRQNRKEDFKHKSLAIQCDISLVLALYFILALNLGQRGITK